MLNHTEFESNASPDDNNNNLEEAMWRLKVEDNNQKGSDSNRNPYPDRPGAADCIYYLRTGLCGYGSNCRYNHPTYNGQEREELPERVDQPNCQYFLKTGTCKFGATCKYHHPRDRLGAQSTLLNIVGLPIRQDEKACPYYMRTGFCKFGIACKFNHPQPTSLGAVFPASGPSAYGPSGSSSSLPLFGGLSPWALAGPPYLTSPRMQGAQAYMPYVLPASQGAMPAPQGWSTYMGSLRQLPSTDGFEPNTIDLPQRPDQPECQYYMKNGSCKYGTSCKYHHPKERYSESSYTLGPLGLPLRPGHAICSFYTTYGSCRYGSACKYDHPLMGFYNYATPSLSSEPSALFSPEPRNLQQATRASSAQSPAKTSKFPESKPDSDDNNDPHFSDSSQNHTG